jgi:hypothetical protein
MALININDLQREADLADINCTTCSSTNCDCNELVGDPDGV